MSRCVIVLLNYYVQLFDGRLIILDVPFAHKFQVGVYLNERLEDKTISTHEQKTKLWNDGPRIFDWLL